MKTYTENFSVEVERDILTNRVASIRYLDDEGRLHRTCGLPAYVAYDLATGRERQRVYAEYGQEHRLGGEPSFQEIDPISGIVWYERWSERGSAKPNGISVVERNAQTGTIVEVIRRVDGRKIIERSDPPQDLDSRKPEP